MITKRKWLAGVTAAAMLVTTLASAPSASALEGEGKAYKSNELIGTYFASDYTAQYGSNAAFEIKFKYDEFDKDGDYQDGDKTVTIDYNNTFHFLVFDTAWGGWNSTFAGPEGVDDTSPLTADDLSLGETYSVTVPIATIERELATENSPMGINLNLGALGDTIVTVESISYVEDTAAQPAGAVTLTGSWVKGKGGNMTVKSGNAHVETNEYYIRAFGFSTKGFVNPTVDVKVTYETAPNTYVQADIEGQNGSKILQYYPYIDVTGTYTYTTELPANINDLLAIYDKCTVTEIRIYDNHEGNALKVSDQKAETVVAQLQPGIGIGNALDVVTPQGGVDETAIGNPPITEKLFQTIKAQGFKSVRIPISYVNMVNAQGDIDDDYLDRIQAVVDRALDTGLYVVINIHNDGGEGITGKWINIGLDNSSAEFKAVVSKFSNMWSEIATRFANYNQALIFEDMNEVMVSGAYNRNQLTDEQFYNAYDNINELNQAFVDAVRGAGNANDDRCLIVPGYNTDIDMTVAGFNEYAFNMPDDSTADRLALSVHYYTPSDFTLNGGTNQWDINGTYGKSYMVSQLTKIAGYDVPVYVGEYSAEFKNNIDEVAEYVGALNAAANEVVEKTGTSIATSYWSNGITGINYNGGTGIIDRKFNIVTSTGTIIIDIIKENFDPYPNPTPVPTLAPSVD